ncbi:MAG: cell division protein FtsZ [Moraxella sp.]
MSKYGISNLENDDIVPYNQQAQFLVFGVGGAGGNAVEHMVQQGVNGVTFVCANTDIQALNRLSVPNKIQLGFELTRGLGAGANPEVGRKSAEMDEEAIRNVLAGHDMVFITAGMGGGTGTGAAPVVARIAKDMEILTVAVVTMPFAFEGAKRTIVARSGLEQVLQYVDSIITIPNDKVLDIYGNIGYEEALRRADDVLLHAVNGLVQTVSTTGHINTDFNDIRTAMTARGYAMMGVGRASGEGRATKATQMAICSPLLDDLRLENAKGLLVNITSGMLIANEAMEVSKILQDLVDLENGHIFYGFVTDESMGDDIHVTVIATGLTVDDEPKIKPAQAVEAIRENVQQVQGGQGASSQSHPYAHQAAPMKMQAQSQTVMDFLNKQAKPS